MTPASLDVPAALTTIEIRLARATRCEEVEVALRQTAALVAAVGGYYHARITDYPVEQAMAAPIALSQLEDELHRVLLPFLRDYEAERAALGLRRLLRLVEQAWEMLQEG